MKNVIFLICSVVMLMGFQNCGSDSKAKLKREIEAANKACPINLGSMGELVKMEYDDVYRVVKFHFSTNDDIVDIENLQNNYGLIKESMKLSFARGEYREMVKDMIDAGVGLEMIFKSSTTGKKFEVQLTHDDLVEMYNNAPDEESISETLLKNMVTTENAACPTLVDNGLVLRKVSDDGSNVIYEYSLNESVYDMNHFKNSQSEVRKNLKENFQDPSTKSQLETLVANGRGVIFKYTGETSGKSLEIEFAPHELSAL